MADWLIAHQNALQSCLLLGAFGIVAAWELLSPRRPLATSVGVRWFNHIALTAVGYALVRGCLPLAAFAVAALAEQRGWGVLNQASLPVGVSVVLGVLIIDLAGYAQHRLFHASPLLWRFHQIHHSDLDVDCATALRHHPVETLVASAIDIAVVAAFGIPPLAVLLATVLLGIANVFNHGDIALASTTDRRLRWFVVTPDMHRIHHSASVDESNRNYSMLFPWWDHLFSTYRREPAMGHERMALGLAEARRESDVTLWKLIALPFRKTAPPPTARLNVSHRQLFP